MRAAIRSRFGPPDVVRIEEVAVPAPGPDDVLVAVCATTVNRTDCHYRSGRPLLMRAVAGVRRPKVACLGTEYSGIVADVGTSVTNLDVGDRVFGWIEGRFGAHAEFLVARATGAIAHVPDSRPIDEAAALTEGTHYALNALRKLGVGPSTRLLVYGATGSIGTAAVQLGRAIGATVTAVGPTEHLALLERLGAHDVLDFTAGPLVPGPERHDAVLDAWGHAPYFSLRHFLRPTGLYCSTGSGAHGEVLPLTLLAPVLPRRRVRFAYPHIDQAMVQDFADRYGDGIYAPVIDRRFPLDEIVDAYRYVERGQKVGNVLIDVAEGRPPQRPA